MSFFAIWVLFSILTGAVLSFCTWWEMSHPTFEEHKVLKLDSLLLGIFFTLCPIIQILAFLFGAWFFIENIAPDIVVFKKS